MVFSVITNSLNWEIFGCNTYREKGIRFQRDSFYVANSDI